MVNFVIIFRTCDVVHSLHNAPRPFGLDKRTLIKICFISLFEAVQGYNYTIYVLGDKLSDEMKGFFARFPVNVINGSWGNDESIRQSFLLADRVKDEDWVYFCEDDYLHKPETFKYITDLIENRNENFGYKPRRLSLELLVNPSKKPLIIHLPDYPDRYQPRYRRFSLIFLSSYCHWRQITNTTFSFFTEGKTFRKFRKIFEKSVKNADDGYLSRRLYGGLLLFGKALCISPIHGLSTHMHEGVMTPSVDWEEIYNEMMTKVKLIEAT
ncbi:MAG: hypothetical protein HYZ54_09445 [Ignavibacteriae bacterium]|nr:hypothetical protein [Ignavibacteriota bacterium]